MAESAARIAMTRRLRAAAANDPRIAGVVEYGSGSEGRADEWSDIDLTLLIREADYATFTRDWVAWAGGFGPLLLAYTGRHGHPWAVYDTTAVPLRVDFYFLRASEALRIREEGNAPLSVEAMVWYDATDGALVAAVLALVGRSQRPADLAETFASISGDFWYYLLYVWCKLQRGEHWLARQAFHQEVTEQLLRLLRLEAGALERWQSNGAAVAVEQTLSSERLRALDGCVPASGSAALRQALVATVALGRVACLAIAARDGYPWPAVLAERIAALLAEEREHVAR